MKNLENFLDGYSTIEKRSSLYYLTRYIKQAGVFEKYEKDIFEDGLGNNPDEKVKLLTLQMIAFVESTANKKASEFNRDEFYFWMDTIAEIEDTIDAEPSEEQIQKALNEIDKFDVPKTNNDEFLNNMS